MKSALVIVTVVLLLAASIYIYFTNATSVYTSQTAHPSSGACITNIANPPQEQYAYLLRDLVNNSDFVSATQGRCFTFNSGFVLSTTNSSMLVLIFDHQSASSTFKCGDIYVHPVDERLRVSPQYDGSSHLTGFRISVDNTPIPMSCPQKAAPQG